MNKTAFASLAVFAALGAIVVGSLLPKGILPSGLVQCNTVLHAVAFGMTTLVAALLCKNGRQLFFVAVALLVAGLVLELLQNFVPGRNVSGLDLFANVFGVTVGTILAYASARVHTTRALEAQSTRPLARGEARGP